MVQQLYTIAGEALFSLKCRVGWVNLEMRRGGWVGGVLNRDVRRATCEALLSKNVAPQPLGGGRGGRPEHQKAKLRLIPLARDHRRTPDTISNPNPRSHNFTLNTL